jgi:aspartyl-tRNA(Asn)/glutamyl-tRNA(Gln) amidotransferase subunit A
MADALHFLTIAEASQRLWARTLSPVDLTAAFIARIKALDPQLHSFLLVTEDSAMAEARQAEAEIAAGGWIGPLHGIPIGLKDIYCTRGVPTTANSALLRGHVPKEDATTVRLLRSAGAIVLGKLGTHEFAIGGPSFDLPWPPPRNPWNLAHQPGGSSSGSGVAVAAGLCAGAMGSDTGGSIRFPAAWCGIAGLKPTYGLVSRRGILPLAYSLDHGGPMCWTTEDCALMMQVLAAYDPLDPGSVAGPAQDFAGSLQSGISGLRIGVVRNFLDMDTGAGSAIGASQEVFRRLGAVVSDVRLSSLTHYNDVATTIARAEWYAIHERTLRASPELYGQSARIRLMAGAFVSGADYVNAQRHRARLAAEMAAVMQGVDILLTPTWNNDPAPLYAGEEGPLFPDNFTMPFNVTGNPALAICNGFTPDGLPLSMQLVGRPFEDHLTLRAGHAFECATPFRDRRPPLTNAIAAAA